MRGGATAFDFNHMARLKPRTARNRRERQPLGVRAALGHLVVTGIAGRYTHNLFKNAFASAS
jgi:hypothetical protein